MSAAVDSSVKEEPSWTDLPDERMSAKRCAAGLDPPESPPQRYSWSRNAADECRVCKSGTKCSLEPALQKAPRLGARCDTFCEVVGNDSTSAQVKREAFRVAVRRVLNEDYSFPPQNRNGITQFDQHIWVWSPALCGRRINDGYVRNEYVSLGNLCVDRIGYGWSARVRASSMRLRFVAGEESDCHE